ncbi:MAG: PDZ domain-containing protein [Clostridiales bacterium]|jgi:carboxyl-terminal processing protease|nr:PDZ domain-containing protein [Clostridiales bacterium]
MSKTIRITTALVLCIAVAVITFVSVSVYLREQYDAELDRQHIAYNNAVANLNKKYEDLYDISKALKILKEAQNYVDQNYLFDIDDDAVKTALSDAMYDILFADTAEGDIQDYLLNAYFSAIGDDYTLYHSKAEMEELSNSSKGRLYGIGVYVYQDPDTGYIYVNRVMPGSPAETAGLLRGDAIINVEGTPVTSESYSQCVSLVAGELGTTVKLKILRNGNELDINPVRGEVRTTAVYTEYKNDYAYITITEFSGHVAEDFSKAIDEAESKGIKGYIFDMRDNPGGNLDIICSVLDKLLPEGPIITLMDKDKNVLESYNSDADCINKPMVVLCNENTASAGELFTAALKDYQMATVIGTTTFGKGTGQNIWPLSDGSGVRITHFYYNPPFSENYHLKGITPNIIVEESEYYKNRPFLRGGDDDEQLNAAVAELDRLTKPEK